MVGPDNDPAVTNTDFDADMPEARVGGAITDGASLCLVRVRPPGLSLAFQTRIELPNKPYTDRPRVVGALFPTGDDPNRLPEFPAPADPEAIGWSCTAGMTAGKAFYLPPDGYLDSLHNVGGAFWLDPVNPTPVVFRVMLNNAVVGGAPFFLRRPPVVLVHGLMGSGTGYWDPAIYSENPGVGNHLKTRIYAADYGPVNTKGYDEIFPSVPRAISEALADYRAANDNAAGGHHPRHGFKGVRYAATRADVVGHSMGGQAIRAYISNVTASGPRQAGSQWSNYNFSRTPTSTGFRVTYQRPDNYGVGDIRRFIAIGSPFKGSPIANAVAPWAEPTENNIHLIESLVGRIPPLFDLYLQYVEPSAVHDLQVDSTVQQLLTRLPGASVVYPADQRLVPWFPMVGIASQDVELEGVWGILMEVIEAQGGAATGLLPHHSDLVVNRFSQRNATSDLDYPNASIGQTFEYTVHSEIATATGLTIEYQSLPIAAAIAEILSKPRTHFGNGDMGR